jgi:hypothetical protein
MEDYLEKPDGVQISTLTPTSGNVITPERWANLNFTELLEQKNILIKRFDSFSENGNKEAAALVFQGITELDSLIQAKSKNFY